MANAEKAPVGLRTLSYAGALHESLTIALSGNPDVFLLGQGVDDPSGYWGVTKDLHLKFGGERVFDVPLSEEGITGVCVGAAMAGKRPILFHNRPDFILLSFNQLVTHAAKMHYMDNGISKVPLVIWSAIGRGWGSGAQHSQAIQGMLLGVPGLKILMPSTPRDAKGLLLSAIDDNNPVLIFEHRWMMRKSGEVPQGNYKIPIGKGIYRKRGDALTVVGTSHALDVALQAVEAGKFDADVIDLRTIKPLDKDIILQSLQRTGRLLVVDTGWSMGGVCAEIGCLAAENFKLLKAPIQRVAMPDVPTPAGYDLEQYIYPSVQTMTKAIRKLLE